MPPQEVKDGAEDDDREDKVWVEESDKGGGAG